MAKPKTTPPIPKPAIQPGAGGSLQSGTLVRSPLYLEQQKFKDKEKLHKQLSLSLDGRELEEAVEASGLDLSDLSVSELKAYDAVSQLLSRTGHKGSEPGKEAEVESMKWRGVLPVLLISRSDYFEAYGLKRKGDGSYYGHQAEEALEALRSLLTATRRVVYSRTTWSGKGKSRKAQREAVVYTGPLASIMERYRDLSEEEQAALHQGVEPDRRSIGLEVLFGPIFMDGLDSFYVLRPATMYKEIQAARRPKPVRRPDLLFADWLQTWNRQDISISKDKLMERIGLESYLKSRHKREAEAILLEVIETAQRLGYLLSWEERPGQLGESVLHFKLNPERIGRLKAKAEASAE